MSTKRRRSVELSSQDKNSRKRQDILGSSHLDSQESRTSRRHGTLYDAVAGRLTTKGFRRIRSAYWGDLAVTPTAPITPFEALFKDTDAPVLYQEEDLYSAHRYLSEPPRTDADPTRGDLGGRGQLPDSDLLKASHEYVSEYYGASTVRNGTYDWRSMDETALLALGILMEEEVSRLLGKNGWAVFVEPVDENHDALDEEKIKFESRNFYGGSRRGAQVLQTQPSGKGQKGKQSADKETKTAKLDGTVTRKHQDSPANALE